MEMRKFIVEIHRDGTVHAIEYEDQKENPVEIRRLCRLQYSIS